MFFIAVLLISSYGVRAEDKVTVEATSEDISESLDLKAVATLFGQVKDLKEFEEKLNAEDTHLSNLDLNGDGTVDYLRVVESKDGDSHLVLIQAILAKDVYQDVASIYVEHLGDDNVSVQVIGDEYIYGTNYVIEPVYIYRPVIYDWFWGPAWVCYTSPWYWGYWPGWYAPYPCWGYHDYWVHIHVYHHDHPCCSYRYAREGNHRANEMRRASSRTDYARTNADRSFSSRTGKTNARELSAARSSRSAAARGASATTASRSASATTATRGTAAPTATSRATYGSRNTAATTTRSTAAATATRSTAATTTTRGATATTRGASATTATRSASSYSGSGSRGSYSGTSSRSSSYGGSSRSSSYSGGGYSGGSSRGSSYSGGGYSGSSRSSGFSGGGYSGGGASRGASFSGSGRR